MEPGTIIVLNGTSSSGKSTLVSALQRSLDAPFLDAGIDKFIWMLPERYLSPPLWAEVFAYSYPDGELHIAAGRQGHALVAAMHRAIVAIAEAGINVVADHVLLDPAWVADCARLLAELPAFFVGVRCPLAVVEERERTRRDRTLGQARAQFALVHAHETYDIEVDTSVASADECASVIVAHVLGGASPMAFRALAGRSNVTSCG